MRKTPHMAEAAKVIDQAEAQIQEALRQLYAVGIRKAAQTAREIRETKNAAQEGDGKYSLRAFMDGTRFVDVQADQDVFDGLTIPQMANKAKEILRRKFAGKIIGIDNTVFMNNRKAGEYARPAKKDIQSDAYEAKLRASPELDNLIDAGRNFRKEEDGKDGHLHPDAVNGFSYFDTTFKVGKEYFEGVVNILNSRHGKLFKDVTKLRNVTKEIHNSYGIEPQSMFLRDTSMSSIYDKNEKVNPSGAKNSSRYVNLRDSSSSSPKKH